MALWCQQGTTFSRWKKIFKLNILFIKYIFCHYLLYLFAQRFKSIWLIPTNPPHPLLYYTYVFVIIYIQTTQLNILLLTVLQSKARFISFPSTNGHHVNSSLSKQMATKY